MKKFSAVFFIGSVSCVLFFGNCFAVENLPGDERMDILAYFSVPAEFTSPQRYLEMAECGFTHGLTWGSDIEKMDAMLDAAEKGGIKLFVNYPKLAEEPEKIANHFRDHPALAGYYIKDEPSAKLFPQLAETVKRIQAVDTRHSCYINLFPNYAAPEQLGTETYQQYIDRRVRDDRGNGLRFFPALLPVSGS